MIIINQSCPVFLFNPANALDNTEVLSSAIILYSKQASCIGVFWMHVDNKVLQVLYFLCALVVVGKQFLYQFLFTLFKSNIVWVSAQNVLEQAL